VKVLLDVNIVLDTLLAREPWRADAEAVWAACDEGGVAGHLAAITLTTVFYLWTRRAEG
jgi:predicted nucleic acid-binding protein